MPVSACNLYVGFQKCSKNVPLMPPFILREAGIIINDTAKIHKDDPGQGDHAIIVESESLIIPLQLNGIFLFFL